MILLKYFQQSYFILHNVSYIILLYMITSTQCYPSLHILTLNTVITLARRLHLTLAPRLHHRQPITLDFFNRDNYTLEVYYNPVISPVWIFILLTFLQSL